MRLRRRQARRRYLPILFAALALALCGPPTLGADLYVATTGTDSPSCTDPLAPCRTVLFAVSQAAPSGDTIHVAPGTYVEILAIDKSLTIAGAGADSTIVDGDQAGSVFVIRPAATVTIADIAVTNGRGVVGGGILIQPNSTLYLDGAIVAANVADTGGGLFSWGTAAITKTAIERNAASDGAGIANDGDMTLADCKIAENSATSAGGGIYSWVNLAIASSTLYDNTALRGGGLGNSGYVLLVNSTISGNSALEWGGGIRNFGPDYTIRLHSCTVSDNTASEGGGIGTNPDSTLILTNTIVADNNASVASPDCFGTLRSEGFNLLGDTSNCTLSGDLTGNVINVGAFLATLSDNGGLSPTHALRSGSPAIDAGNPAGCQDGDGGLLSTDQRGEPRVFGVACDIGSYELGECIDLVPPDQGNVLLAVKVGTDVVLRFEGAPATLWRLYRDSNKASIGVTALPPDVAVPVFTDSGSVTGAPGEKLFYYLRGLSPCTMTPGP